MKTLLTFLILLFAASVCADTPIGLKKWHVAGNEYRKQIGGSVRNYQKPNQTWAQIANNFIAEGDSVLKVDAAVIKTRINKNGVSSSTLTWDGQNYTVTQKLLGIGWIKISTRGRQWIDSTMNWSNVLTDSNIVTWTGISPGVDYRVRKQNGQVEHGVFFKPAFLDSAVILYNQRADSLDIALANVMVYMLSGNIDNADSGLGELTQRQLKSFGKYTFSLSDQNLRYPGWDTLAPIPVKQFWRKRNDSIFCIEYVMMSDVKAVHETNPTAVVWHNDTKKIEGTTNIEDNYMRSNSGESNFGSTISIQVLESGGTVWNGIVRVQNVATEIGAGATITFAACSLWQDNSPTDGNVSAYSIFKPWDEGTQNFVACSNPGSSWNDWDCTTNEWTTAGCQCAGDDGSDNSTDNGACGASTRDRKSTAESTTNVTETQTRYGWNINNALAQGWYDGTKNEEGLVFIAATGVTTFFSSTENATSSERPFFTFVFTTGGNKIFKKVKLEGVKI